MAEYKDRVLQCVECGADFVFTAGEQQFFMERNFRNDPKRCKSCKGNRNPRRDGLSPRTETTIACSQCGRETTVPFRPTQGRPIYCRECFQQRRTASSPAGSP